MKNSINLQVEKITDGYVVGNEHKAYRTDISKIIDYSFVEKEILESINEDGIYYINISLSKTQQRESLSPLLRSFLNEDKEVTEELVSPMTVEEAKEAGIIQVEKFNPFKTRSEETMSNVISVNETSAYSTQILKDFPWDEMHEKLPLTPSEKADIAGLKPATMYNILTALKQGKSPFQSVDRRIGMTTLAKHYEWTLGVRSTTKDQCEALKKNLLQRLEDLELLFMNKNFVPRKEAKPLILAMKDLLGN